VAGEKLIALPEKALYWPAESTLFVADVHLGKDASFQAAGIPVPLGPTSETLLRLGLLLSTMRPARLVLLGDLWHSKAGRTTDLTTEFLSWRRANPSIEMLLVEGNQDAKAGPLPAGADVTEVKEPYVTGPFALCHDPEPCPEGYVLGGHIHPGVVLHGKGRQAMKFPCFWFGKQVAVLPAFGLFTGCGTVSPSEGDQVFIVAGGNVVPAQISS
jgi:DNA ligase-associated metallophosphoesterase